MNEDDCSAAESVARLEADEIYLNYEPEDDITESARTFAVERLDPFDRDEMREATAPKDTSNERLAD